jgi:hypothetical protein
MGWLFGWRWRVVRLDMGWRLISLHWSCQGNFQIYHLRQCKSCDISTFEKHASKMGKVVTSWRGLLKLKSTRMVYTCRRVIDPRGPLPAFGFWETSRACGPKVRQIGRDYKGDLLFYPEAVSDQVPVKHPSFPDLEFIYGTILTDGKDHYSDQPTKNVTIFADCQVRICWQGGFTHLSQVALKLKVHALGVLLVGIWPERQE